MKVDLNKKVNILIEVAPLLILTFPGLIGAVVSFAGVRESGELRERRLTGPEVWSLLEGLSNLINNLGSSNQN